MRYTEGRAWLSKCDKGHCEAPVIEAHVNGFVTRLSIKAVPPNDAYVLSKYERIVINVWIGPTQLWANAWNWALGEVLDGRLYIEHRCGARP